MFNTNQENSPNSTGSKSFTDQSINKDEKETQEDTLKSVALFFLENCTAHGLPRVAIERSAFRKILWAIIFAGALGYFCYTLQSIVRTFLKYEVNVNTILHSRDRVIFPAVTVCNLNRLRSHGLNGTHYETIKKLDDTYRNKIDPSFISDSVDRKLLKQPNYSEPAWEGAGSVFVQSSSDSDVNQNEYDSQYENDVQHEYDVHYDYDPYYDDPLYNEAPPFQIDDSELYSGLVDDYDFPGFLHHAKTNDYSDLQDILRPNKSEYDRWGYRKGELIVQCSFDRKDCNITADFTHTYSTAYGNCYTFNSVLDGDPPKYTNRHGSIYGLRLTLDVKLAEYLGMFTQEVGVRVSVHDPKVFPFPESYGYNAPIGKSTSLGVRTTLVRREPHPYTSNCASDDDQDLFYNGSYTLENCQLSCYRKELLRRCNCVDTVLNTPEEPRCGLANATQVICRQKVKYDYSNQKLSCLDNCTEPCRDITFSASASYVEWPNERYGYYLVDKLRILTGDQNLTLREVKDNMVRVHVYMDSFELLEIVESPAYTWDMLLADCGGTLGLFIGLSVCTALEFLELIIDCIIVLTKKCCERDRKGAKSRSIQVKPSYNDNPV